MIALRTVTLDRYTFGVKRRGVCSALLLLLIIAGLFACGWRQFRIEHRYNAQILTAARRYSVDPLLVKAIVWQESRFRADRRGRHGEIGLMQIQEVSAQEWADAEHVEPFVHENCLDPGTNTLAGTYYFSKVLKRYAGTDNPIPYALADYNAGRANVLRWKTGAANTNSAEFIEHIGFPSTKKYVKSVLHRYKVYRFLARLGWI